jgi:protocatechuate 3,4-dioxygenase beta subunit
MWRLLWLAALALAALGWVVSEREPRRTEQHLALAPEASREADPPAMPASAESTPSAEQGDRAPLVQDAARAAALEPLPAGGLRVRVLDAAGNPAAGVRVELHLSVANMGSGAQAHADTRAPDGRARLDLGELAAQRAAAMERGLTAAFAFSIRADVAAATPVEAPLAGWPEEGQEVELRLPALGSLEVVLRQADGSALPGEGSVAWFWVPADVAAADPTCAYDRVGEHIAQARDGVAKIERLGMGLVLSLSASADGLAPADARGILGPEFAGEVRRHELCLGPPLARAHLRVLGPNGKPLSSARLRGALWHEPERVPAPHAGPPRPAHLALATDAAGVATFELVPCTLPAPQRLDLQHRAEGPESARDESWALGSVLLPAEIAAGAEIDLGEVALAAAPILAEGVVVDDAGLCLAGARVNACERFGEGPDHAWHNLPEDAFQTTGLDGRFRVRGLRPGALALGVTAPGLRARELEQVEIGARGLVIQLERESSPPTGALAIEVALEPEIPFLELLLRLERRGGGGHKPDWYPGATLVFPGLAPGTYDVSLETRDGDFELARVSGVKVRAGETGSDARLQPFDARGSARRLVLELARPDGTPWRRAAVELTSLDPEASFSTSTDDQGRVALVLPRHLSALWVALEGGEPLRVLLASADRVRLSVGPPAGKSKENYR